MKLSRRDFLRYASSLAATISVSTAITGCTLQSQRAQLGAARFDHGVASGDPTADSLILWTHAAPNPGANAVTIGYEIATDAGFTSMLRSATVLVTDATDFTVKLDVQGLEPGTRYYYRFRDANGFSPVGRARTLPVGAIESVRMAVFSCSNYPAGYFHAYGAGSKLTDLDVFLHLGDYIYEYGAGGYATERADELGRTYPPNNAGELYTLTDYRRRYALYRKDPDLQAVHAAAPMIAVWDDHEIANNTWTDGAENHGTDEGSFLERKAAAVQAYFEWLPLRPITPDPDGRIYRGFPFGSLVDLHMLDTRLIGREQQLEYSNYIDADTGAMDGAALGRALGDPNRSLLGDAQRVWLFEQLAASKARWQVLGQQILIARMQMPAEMLSSLFRTRGYAGTAALIEELATLKKAVLAGDTIEAAALKRLQQALPYNLDAWDGYDAERERLYAHAQQVGKQLVVLAGDTHNAWYSELRDRAGTLIGVEWGTPGVTSPGMESFLKLDNDAATALADALTVLIDELQYCEIKSRGFLEVEFTSRAATAKWHFLDDITRKTYRVTTHEVVYSA